MRGYFSQDEAEDAGILTDSEDDNEVLRKIDRKGCLLFIRYQYYAFCEQKIRKNQIQDKSLELHAKQEVIK